MEEFVIETASGSRQIGPGRPTFIVAELSANHLGSFERALELVDAAADAGADAVKLQTYTADTMTIDCEAEPFQVKINDNWRGQTLYQLYQKAFTPWEWHAKLKERADQRGILLFSSPFDFSSVDLLEDLQIPLYKVASLEINYVQLLEYIGQRRKPVIISRGLSTAADIDRAISVLTEAGAPSVAVLHCVSSYPSTAEQMNLRTIPDLAQRFSCLTGLSDHSLCRSVPITAVTLGASIIEKHITLSRADGGPDAEFSLEPAELRTMVDDIRECEKSLGSVSYHPEGREAEHGCFRRSIMVVRDIDTGETFTEENLRVIRPGHGLEPFELGSILGKKASGAISRGAPMEWSFVE